MNRPATYKPLCFGALRWSQLLAAVLATIACGCAGPWAQSGAVQLPATTSTPSGLDRAAAAKELTLPHIKQAALEQARQQMEPEGALPVKGNLNDQPAETTLSPDAETTIRGQSADEFPAGSGSSHFRDAMPVTEAGQPNNGSEIQLAQYEESPGGGSRTYGGTANTYNPSPSYSGQSYGGQSYGGESAYDPTPYTSPQGQAPVYSPGSFGEQPPAGYGPNHSAYDGSGIGSQLPAEYADLVVNLRETQTGRFMFGVGVNSDLGLTAQAIIDERNFDWRRWPRSLNDVINGTAWRGGGQTLRIEAVPGTEVQRYLVNFTQPYLFDTPISFNVSGYLYDRRYFDWDEQRLGGRIGFGYRITPDLSLGLSIRAEQVDFTNARVRGIPIIEDVLGESDIFSGKVTLTHDTRDIPFAATQGHFLELSYEQVFGSFDYPRGNIDYRRYFLLRQRADGSGRHTMSFSFKGGISGSQTPVFENFFAGGYSTLRGFRFRHASPKIQDVIVGGQLSLLGSAEYIFPITADDMLKGAVFCDYGTVEEAYDDIDTEDFRVAIGAGLRISVPAMGPAPIAVDFAVPISREGTDRIQNFSFFMGMMR